MMYIFAYLLTWLSGLIVFIIASDSPRMKMNALQAIVLGILGFVVVWIVPFFGGIIDLLIWLFGLYLGYVAYDNPNSDYVVPALTEFAANAVGYKLK